MQPAAHSAARASTASQGGTSGEAGVGACAHATIVHCPPDGPVEPGPIPAMTERPSLTYRDAGVDIDAGEELVERIKPRVARTHRPEVLAGIGGFGAMIEIPEGRWKRPVLVAGTDGVGTKLRLAIDTGLHDGVGQDLVAMCANDVVVQGAEPLFFLDYYATGRLSVDVAERVIAGIAEGCVRRAARWSAARPPRCPACTRRATMTSRVSAWVSSSATASSTAAARAPATPSSGSPRRARTRTASR